MLPLAGLLPRAAAFLVLLQCLKHPKANPKTRGKAGMRGRGRTPVVLVLQGPVAALRGEAKLGPGATPGIRGFRWGRAEPDGLCPVPTPPLGSAMAASRMGGSQAHPAAAATRKSPSL